METNSPIETAALHRPSIDYEAQDTYPASDSLSPAGLASSFDAHRPHAQAPARFVGSVTAITGTSLTVKTDAGDQRQFDVPAEAIIKRIAPGEKDLTRPSRMAFTDLAVGDRVLVKLDPDSPTPAGRADHRRQAGRPRPKAAEGPRRLAAPRSRRPGEKRRSRLRSHLAHHRCGSNRQDRNRAHHQGDHPQAIRVRLGPLRSGPARAHRCHPPRRPVARARRQERRWLRDHRRRSRVRQLPQHLRNHLLHRSRHLNLRHQRSGHQEAGHRPHYVGCADAPPSRSHGADAGHAFERGNPGSRGPGRSAAAAVQPAAHRVVRRGPGVRLPEQALDSMPGTAAAAPEARQVGADPGPAQVGAIRSRCSAAPRPFNSPTCRRVKPS